MSRLLLFLAACSSVPSAQLPPPAGTLALEAPEQLVVGVPVTLQASGDVLEGESVYLVGAYNGLGLSCPRPILGQCLGLASPIQLLQVRTADADGAVQFDLTPSDGAGLTVGAQAVVLRGFRYQDSLYSDALALDVVDRVDGCTNPEASNYDPSATVDDGSCSDAFLDDVVLLMRSDAPDGNTDFEDLRGLQTITATGPGVYHSTAQSKFGTSSLYFDSTSDRLRVAGGPAWDVTGDYTYEAWVYLIDLDASRSIFGRFDNGSNWFDLGWSTTYDLYTNAYNGSDRWGQHVQSSGVTPPVGQWFHYVVSIDQGVAVRTFLDGVMVREVPSGNTDVRLSSDLFIGWSPYITDNNASGAMYGYIDSLRVTAGVARYTGDFTPPVDPFPAN